MSDTPAIDCTSGAPAPLRDQLWTQVYLMTLRERMKTTYPSLRTDRQSMDVSAAHAANMAVSSFDEREDPPPRR